MEDAKEAVLLGMPTRETTELVSIHEICRLCANKHEKLITIYSDEGENNDLATKMNSYLPIKVDKADDLPLQCCWQCASTVLAWHELVVTSIEADRRLRTSQLISEKQLQTSTETAEAKVETDILLDNFNESTCPENDSSSNVEKKDEPSTVQPRNQKNLKSNCCVSCKRNFTSKLKLENHMFKMHKEERQQSEVFTCLKCKRSFSRKYDMQRHILKVHSNPTGEPSNRHKNFELLNKHKVLDDGMIYYKCDLCEAKLTKSSSFVDHYNIHLNKKLHCCHLCGKKFRTSSHVNRHINVVHYGNKKFKCEQCDHTFSSKSARDEHVNIHTNNRPYMCALCGKSFKQASSLYVHKMFHAQIYRFTCNICDKKFKRGGELKKHRAVHAGRRDYDCELCKKSFRVLQSLRKHQKSHNSYSCDVCGIDFQQMKLFKIHKKDHDKITIKTK